MPAHAVWFIMLANAWVAHAASKVWPSSHVILIANLELREANRVQWRAGILTKLICLFALCEDGHVKVLSATTPERPGRMILILVSCVWVQKERASWHLVIVLCKPEEYSLHIVHGDEDWPLTREEGTTREDFIDRMIEDQTKPCIIVPAITVFTKKWGKLLTCFISQGNCWLQWCRIWEVEYYVDVIRDGRRWGVWDSTCWISL